MAEASSKIWVCLIPFDSAFFQFFRLRELFSPCGNILSIFTVVFIYYSYYSIFIYLYLLLSIYITVLIFSFYQSGNYFLLIFLKNIL